MWTKKLKIDGMTCPSCVVSIEKKLNAIEDVEIKVSYPEGIAVLTVSGNTRLESLLEQLRDWDFGLKSLTTKPPKPMTV